jgi:predicted transposase YbfD/YdcC
MEDGAGDGAGDGGAFDETVVFLRYFKGLPDPRQRGKVIYPLDEVLLLCLLAVLAGAEAITDIARFGERKLELLRRFRPFADGTPAHDHLGDILASLDAEQFQRCFAAWVSSQTGAAADVVAIDGKTLRRSKGAKAPVHMVSAFAARQRLVLAQVKVADKANEIVAIPRLLDMLAIEGAIVTIDAMGCQRDVARKIIDRRADYVLALKGNQGSLREDVELFVREQKARSFRDTTVTTAAPSVDGDLRSQSPDRGLRENRARIEESARPVPVATPLPSGFDGVAKRPIEPEGTDHDLQGQDSTSQALAAGAGVRTAARQST